MIQSIIYIYGFPFSTTPSASCVRWQGPHFWGVLRVRRVRAVLDSLDSASLDGTHLSQDGGVPSSAVCLPAAMPAVDGSWITLLTEMQTAAQGWRLFMGEMRSRLQVWASFLHSPTILDIQVLAVSHVDPSSLPWVGISSLPLCCAPPLWWGWRPCVKGVAYPAFLPVLFQTHFPRALILKSII